MKLFLTFFLLVSQMLFGEEEPKQHKGILLVGNPRSLTSVFETYMHNRGDFDTFFEPVMVETIKLRKTVEAKNAKDINVNPDLILTNIVNTQKRSFFIKEQAFVLHSSPFVEKFIANKNHQVVFIIREPMQAVLSEYKLLKNSPYLKRKSVTSHMDYKKIENLYNRVFATTGQRPVLINASKLADYPEKVIQEFCQKTFISFNQSQLKWNVNEQRFPPEDIGWFKTVKQSSGFQKIQNTHSLKDPEIDDKYREKLTNLIKENQIVFDRMIKFAI